MTDYKTQDLPGGAVTTLAATDILMITRDPSGSPVDYKITADDFGVKGTFTPTIAGTSAAGTGTYTTQLGRYTQLGDVVHFKLALIWTAHTGTGNMIISGLPATSDSDFSCGVSVAWWSNITLSAVGNKILGYIPASTTQITLEQIGSGASAAIGIDTAASIFVSGQYFVA